VGGWMAQNGVQNQKMMFRKFHNGIIISQQVIKREKITMITLQDQYMRGYLFFPEIFLLQKDFRQD
jgi:hypothetical protein